MLNSSRNIFVIIFEVKPFRNLTWMSIYKKHIPTSMVSFYLKSGIFHEPVQMTPRHPAG